MNCSRLPIAADAQIEYNWFLFKYRRRIYFAKGRPWESLMFIKHLYYKFFNCLHLKLASKKFRYLQKGILRVIATKRERSLLLLHFATYTISKKKLYKINQDHGDESIAKCIRRYFLKGMMNLSVKIIFRLGNKKAHKSKKSAWRH